ncbi:MAG TPA: NAD(P)H-hydrate dehydratase [Clostridia bacterium]|nr:NAD(P)H-hydrate dehydratase [Clostridia bacterium]
MYVVTPEEMRKIDNRAIEEFGIPGIVLMENAAIRTVDVVEREYPNLYNCGRILVLVGGGNNGGDGLAIARHLKLRGADVKAALFVDGDKLAGDAKINYDIYRALDGEILTITRENPNRLGELDSYIGWADLVIDGILGTGITRDIEGIIFDAIKRVNISPAPVVAVDIPSGINGITGQVMGIAVRADYTVTFGNIKRGHLFYPGREYSGKLFVSPISLPQCSAGATGVKAFTLDDGEVSGFLKGRPKDGHKGTFGKVGIIAGSLGMAGAACLTSMAALKSGAGLVTLGSPSSLVPIFQSKMTEVMTYPLEDGEEGYLTKDAIPSVGNFLKDKDVLAIGPGLGPKCHGLEILRYILGEFDISIIMDADALNHISGDTGLLSAYKGSAVITPHPGEMSRLTGLSIDEITKSPIDAATDFARETDVVVLLKGATTVVAHPDGRIYLNTSGNSGMGTGGSGDILTGMIAALAAQGYSAFDAAVYGCYIHGRAGDYAMDEWGETGLVAGDILGMVPLVFKDMYALKKVRPGRCNKEPI